MLWTTITYQWNDIQHLQSVYCPRARARAGAEWKSDWVIHDVVFLGVWHWYTMTPLAFSFIAEQFYFRAKEEKQRFMMYTSWPGLWLWLRLCVCVGMWCNYNSSSIFYVSFCPHRLPNQRGMNTEQQQQQHK